MELIRYARRAAIIVFLSSPWAAAASYAVPRDDCKFNLSPLPITTGRIAAIYPTAKGEEGNLILSDGREVVLPPGFSSHDLALSVGMNVRVRGLLSKQATLVTAFSVIDNGRDICAAPRWPSLANRLTQATAGKVTRILHDFQGFVGGYVLDNGVTIRFPPFSQASDEVSFGGKVFASGQVIATRFGIVILAERMSLNGRDTAFDSPEPVALTGAAPGSPDYDKIAPGPS